MYSTKFRDTSTGGTLKVGMTAEAVRTLLGIPIEVRSRQTGRDLREVWTYVDRYFGGKYNEDDRGGGETEARAFVTGLTLGLAVILMPPPTHTHYLVFSDGKIIGWDLPDPYAPDLIIEKRER